AAHGDFRFRREAPVFRHLPSFAPIPFEKIGLYADALRPKPPAERWTGGPLRPLPVRTAAAAAAPARTGPAPVYRVLHRTVPIGVDGTLDPAEWGGAQPAAAMPLKFNYTGGEAPQARWSRAWLVWDGEALYLAVDNAVAPGTKLDGNQWGTHDAVEVSCRPPQAAVITVVRLYGNGYLQLGTTPTSAEEPKAMDASSVVGKVSAPGPGRWLAELRIPFHTLGVDPAPGLKLPFSLAVRKAADDLWLMWAPTLGNSFAVERAGVIELAP
ncbi:MAG: hypothetical protein HYU66_24895, partial [Armatimonadetes bacterium]|nr:hypothetical protein [Armatimonadota bacterium]